MVSHAMTPLDRSCCTTPRSAGPRCMFALALVACTPAGSPRASAPPLASPRVTDEGQDTEKSPAIAIGDVSCEPSAPAWEQALAEGYAWNLLHAADFEGARASREQASKMVDALPESDARYVEAHCRAGFAHHNLMNVGFADRHYRRAGQALRRREVARPEERYASVASPASSVAVSFTFDATKVAHRITLDLDVGKGLDPDDCRTADFAFIELARADLYRSANSKQIREVPRSNRSRFGTLAADTGAALQDEIVKALGPRHRLAIAMREHMASLCEEAQERRFPERCPPVAELRRRTYEDRLAVLGEQHRETRRAALFLGGQRLADGRTAEAKKLFEQAASAETDEVWIAAQQLLAGLELDAGKPREGFARLQTVAAALPTSGIDFDWTILQAWRLHEEAAMFVGNDAEAERARGEQKRMQAMQHYVGPGGPSVGMIAVTLRPEGAVLHEAAVLGLVQARTQELQRHDLSEQARAWRTKELDVALQCSALLRHRAGDSYGANDDLRALAKLRSALGTIGSAP
jgi:hypothetical protein